MAATVFTNSVVVNNSYPTAASAANNLSAVVAPTVIGAALLNTSQQISHAEVVDDWYIAHAGVPFAVLHAISLPTQALGTIGETLKRKVGRKLTTEAIGLVTDGLAGREKRVRALPTEAIGAITEARKKLVIHKMPLQGMGFIVETRTLKVRPAIAIEALGSITETAKKLGLKKRTEAMGAVTDTPLQKKAFKFRVLTTEALGVITDSLRLRLPKTFTDSLGIITDALQKQSPKYRAFTETLGLITDQTKKLATKKMAETKSILEALVEKALHKRGVTEPSVSVADALKKRVPKTLAQAVGSITDSAKKKAGKKLVQLAITITDIIGRGQFAQIDLGDTISIGDSLQKMHRYIKVLTQTVRTVVQGQGPG